MCKWAFKISGPQAHSVGFNLQITMRRRLAAVHVNDNDTVCDCECPTTRKTIKLNSLRACVVCSVWGGLVKWSIAANKMVHSWSKRTFHQNLSRRRPHADSAQVHTRTCNEFGITSSPASEKAKEKSDGRLRLGGAGPRVICTNPSIWLVSIARPLSCLRAHALNANCMAHNLKICIEMWVCGNGGNTLRLRLICKIWINLVCLRRCCCCWTAIGSPRQWHTFRK